MNRFNRILFVCENGTRRAPMAEGIMKSKFLHSPSIIEGRGLVVLFGEPMNQKAEAVMISNGIAKEDYMSRPLEESDFKKDTLIIVFDEERKDKIFENFKQAQNVYLLTELVGEEGDVIDPYGGSLQDYGRCFEELDRLIKKLVKRMNEEEQNEQ